MYRVARETSSAVARISSILGILASQGSEGVPLSDIAGAADLSKPTAHRLLAAMCRAGFTYQELPSRRYCLGITARMLGATAQRHHISAYSSAALTRLAASSSDTVFCSIVEGTAAVCIGRALGDFQIRTLTLDIGDRRPLGVGAGSLALLAALPDEEVVEVGRRNDVWLRDYPGFSPGHLLSLVARTRADGYAFNDHGVVPQMTGVAVAVNRPDGRPVAALSIAAINERMSASRVQTLIGSLRDEAEMLERLLTSEGSQLASVTA
jgi:DNA-binding IclR family transcriptional regulator